MNRIPLPTPRRPRLTRLSACLSAALALSTGVSASDGAVGRSSQSHSCVGAAAAAMLQAPMCESIAPSGAPTGDGPPPVVVTNCDDSGPGSLREAVETIAVSGDSIDLANLACSTITLTSGAIDVAADYLVIAASGAHPVTIHGGAALGYHDRIFNHTGGGNLSLKYLKLGDTEYTGGANPSGGCIQSQGGVSLFRSQVSGCAIVNTGSVDARGGAIYAKTLVNAKYSSIHGNSISSSAADAHGGGVFVGGDFNADEGDLILNSSSVSGNSVSASAPYFAGAGGVRAIQSAYIHDSTIADNHSGGACGGLNLSGNTTDTASIRNSTISGNSADGAIGGVCVRPQLTLISSTVAFNVGGAANEGSGVSLTIGSDPAELQSSILSNNTSAGNPSDFGGGDFTGANNLVFDIGTGVTWPVGTIHDVDPLLAPLAANGGRTATHAIDASSPALDAGNNTAAGLYDQRGASGHYRRVAGASADIGAFEFDADRIFTHGFEPPPPGL